MRAKQKSSSREAEAAVELILAVMRCSFRVRAFGRTHGFLTAWGAGSYGFLRSLAIEGPLTVPAIARSRPTSRQRMQRLADELASQGLVSFVINPKHRRSKLVRLTAKGDAHYRLMTRRLLSLAGTMSRGMPAGELHEASLVVERLGARLIQQTSRPVLPKDDLALSP